MNNGKIKALINLLDDPDEEVFSNISENLINHGIEIIPDLEEAWEGSLDKLSQERIENLIHDIQFKNTKENIKNWKESESHDLLLGAFLIARYQFPDIEYEKLQLQIEKLKNDVWLELNSNLTALEKVKIFNHILFDINKLSGNRSNFYSPQNSYINQVLESKKGNPISLAIIYSGIAQILDVPIYGVNLPKNFILAYMDSEINENENENFNVLFYINPFNKGLVVGKKEIDYFIKTQKLEPQKSFYIPCDNISIIQRLVLNLIFSYEKLGYQDKIIDLQEIHNILK